MRRSFRTGGLRFMPDPLTVTSMRGGVVEAVGQGDRNTYKTSAAGTAVGGKFVDAVTPGSFLVNVSGAGSVVCIGLAIHDQPANNAIVTVAHHGIWYALAAGAITAGQRLITAAAGAVVAAGAAPDARTSLRSRRKTSPTATGRVKLVL
jgi:hypothetical protein